MSLRLLRSRLIPYLFVATIVTTSLLYFVSRQAAEYFPPIEEGTYVGQIYGERRSGPADDLTFYVQRFKNSDSVLFVVFDMGWEPQVIELRRAYEWQKGKGPMNTEKLPFQVVELESPQGQVMLSGIGSHGSFSGTMVSLDGAKRIWKLHKKNEDVLNSQVGPILKENIDVREWLRTRRRLKEVKGKFVKVSELLEEEDTRIEKLKDFLKDESQLKRKARKQKTELKQQVKQARELRKQEKIKLKGILRELRQLERIKERGKIVRLARKVLHRETKWYLANWVENDSDYSKLMGGTKINFKSLSRQLKRAKEIKRLLGQINGESKKVQDLNRIYRQQLESYRNPEGASSEAGPKRLWDRMFKHQGARRGGMDV